MSTTEDDVSVLCDVAVAFDSASTPILYNNHQQEAQLCVPVVNGGYAFSALNRVTSTYRQA